MIRGLLGAIYVLLNQWGGGTGTELLGRVTDVLAAAGFDHLSLSVLAENEVVRVFYEAHGFEMRDEFEEELFGERVRELEFAAYFGD